jgi:hypothetical protein
MPRTRKPLTAAEVKPAPPSSRDLDEIIRERTAGLPFEQATEVALRAVREALMASPDAPLILTGMERILVILALEQRLPPKERSEIERQRLLRNVERALESARWAKKNIWPIHRRKGEPQPTVPEVVRQVIFRDPYNLDSRFPTIEALGEFVKRERRAKKKKSQR